MMMITAVYRAPTHTYTTHAARHRYGEQMLRPVKDQ